MGRVEDAPGFWKPGRGTAGHRRTALLSCPRCGEVFSLTGHRISEAGVVHPSVVCPFGCGFHDLLDLKGWPGLAG